MRKNIALFILAIDYLITIIFGGSLGSLDISLIAGAGVTIFGSLLGTIGENIYLAMTTLKRGTIPQLLSSIYYPLNPEDPTYSNGVPASTSLDLRDTDGETITMASIMLYFFSLSSLRKFNGEPKELDSQPIFPWGPLYSYQHPVVTVSQIRSWLIRQEGRVIHIPLEKVALYDLYPLAVVRKYIEIRRKRRGYEGINSLSGFQKRHRCPNRNLKPFIRDFFQGVCFSKERCKGIGNSNVVYCEPEWKIHSESTELPPEENENAVNLERIPSSIEYIGNIYEYIETQKYELSTETLEKLSPNLLLSQEGMFGLAVILYERQLQYLLGNVERANFKEPGIKKWFRELRQKIFRFLDFGRVTYGGEGKKKPMTRASWKQYPDSLWKKSPLKTWVHSVEKTRYCTLTGIKYNTRKWNEMDYVIAAIYYYFIRWQGIPRVYGQFVIEKTYLDRLSKVSQRLVNSTVIETSEQSELTFTTTREPDYQEEGDDSIDQDELFTSTKPTGIFVPLDYAKKNALCKADEDEYTDIDKDFGGQSKDEECEEKGTGEGCKNKLYVYTNSGSNCLVQKVGRE